MEKLQITDIVNLASAYYGSAVLFAAIDNDVFTTVKVLGDDATSENIAVQRNVSARGMRLLLDAAVAVGILDKDGDRYFNTKAGELALVSGAPADLSKAILYNRDVYPAWGKLSRLVETGLPVEAPALHLGDDQARTRTFALSMRGRAMAIGRCVIPMLNLSGERLLDLAGGPGAFAVLMAQANPNLACVTVDLPAISDVARECVTEAGMSARIECRHGDYHTSTYESEAYDIVTIFGALHQESPEQIVGILKRAYAALKRGGRIYILDMMTDVTRTTPAFSALFAVNMALTTQNGWVFSDIELKQWLKDAGFTPGEIQHVPPPMPHWLLSATK